MYSFFFFFFSSRRRHTRCSRDWSSDVCSSDLKGGARGDDAVAFLPAGSAGIDGFPNAEQTVSQSFSPALNRLLYVHAAATDRAGLGRFAHDQRNRLHLVHLFAIALVQRSDDASQGLPCLERTWGVFLDGSGPRWFRSARA